MTIKGIKRAICIECDLERDSCIPIDTMKFDDGIEEILYICPTCFRDLGYESTFKHNLQLGRSRPKSSNP